MRNSHLFMEIEEDLRQISISAADPEFFFMSVSEFIKEKFDLLAVNLYLRFPKFYTKVNSFDKILSSELKVINRYSFITEIEEDINKSQTGVTRN